mgnify:FL=1|tara:strand:- start:1879 stop:2049 length:171 start_codon:yes stop_codon:yes gene_type:complete
MGKKFNVKFQMTWGFNKNQYFRSLVAKDKDTLKKDLEASIKKEKHPIKIISIMETA